MLAGKVVRTRLSQVATVITPPQGDAQVKAVPPEKLVKPKSMAEFADILVTWTMLLSGLGLASILVSGAFLREVVFDTIADGTLPWEGAYELWLVYLEEVERTAGDENARWPAAAPSGAPTGCSAALTGPTRGVRGQGRLRAHDARS